MSSLCASQRWRRHGCCRWSGRQWPVQAVPRWNVLRYSQLVTCPWLCEIGLVWGSTGLVSLLLSWRSENLQAKIKHLWSLMRFEMLCCVCSMPDSFVTSVCPVTMGAWWSHEKVSLIGSSNIVALCERKMCLRLENEKTHRGNLETYDESNSSQISLSETLGSFITKHTGSSCKAWVTWTITACCCLKSMRLDPEFQLP